jgi:hypothetical protein
MKFEEANEILTKKLIGKYFQITYPFDCPGLIYDIKFLDHQPDPKRSLGKIWKSSREFNEKDILSFYSVSFYANYGFYSHTINWKFKYELGEKTIFLILVELLNELKKSNF